MLLSRLDADGKVELPKELTEALGMSPGDQIGFNIEEGHAVLFREDADEVEPITGLTTREMRALLAEAEGGPTRSLDEVFERLHVHVDEVARRANAA